MHKAAIRLILSAAAVAFVMGLVGCHTDSEVERTKLPSIDTPQQKKVETNK